MADNLEKLKRDQKYLYSMFTDTLTEVAERGTLGSLQVSVDEYHKNMSQMEETVKRYCPHLSLLVCYSYL